MLEVATQCWSNAGCSSWDLFSYHPEFQENITMSLPWLTPDLWKNWDKVGKQTFIKECKKLLADPSKSEDSPSLPSTPVKATSNGRDRRARKCLISPREQISAAIYQLLKQGLKGVLRKDRVISAFTEIMKHHQHSAAIITDVFSIVDLETASSSSDSAGVHREYFCSIVRSCNPMLSYMLQERMDLDSLQEVGAVNNRKLFNTRFIRIKTKMYYKQQKFNLFREESEGYAKLIAELNQEVEDIDPNYMIEVVQCLIGRFNLDPNRVVDCVLEAFECQLDGDFFIPLLQKLSPSSETICELLGFKLTSSETPSESLFQLISLLIVNDIIDIEKIYSWLTPDDRIIQKDWERELKDAKEYARKSMIVTINKENVDEQEDLNTDVDRYLDNQKFCLCEALIGMGAWDQALKLIGRLPEFCCVSNARIAQKLIQYIHFLIDPLYKEINALNPLLAGRTVNAPDNYVRAINPIATYEEFQENIKVFLTLGPYIYNDPVVIYKLLRIMKSYLSTNKQSPKSKLYFDFLTILDEVILPAICFLDANCSLSEEIWSVLHHYPYHYRFRLYGSWKGDSIVLLHPSLIKKRVDAVKKVKHLMRRISKENVKPMGRLLGKLSHSMPTIIFDYVLSQIQLFDNLITPVIDALKFLTSLSYDVLGYCLLEAMSPSVNSSSGQLSLMLMPNRPRTKHDGSTISQWLQSLASFVGAICKKYSLELVPLLQYVANQLKSKQSLDLLLLKEIVHKMTGIEAAEEMTTEQLDAMAGGELLRGEAGYFGQVRTAKKSAGRLREAVSVNDLAVSLCILMAQQRNCIIYDESQSLHTKLVGKLYDQCQDTLVQFGTFLATSCTLDDYAKKIPCLENLVEEYHVSSDAAFFLWRPLFAHSITAKYDELRRAEKSHKSLTTIQRQKKYAQASGIVLGPVVETMKNCLPAKTWEDISPLFYVTFWSYTLYDLYVPTEAYAREIARIKQMSVAAGENKDLASSKRKKEQERCSALIEKLQEEERRQREHVDRVMAKLNKEKETWFASRTAKSAKNEAVTAFLQLCLFPRCIFTAPDTLYCAHFVNIIHSLSTPNFSTLICYDRIFCDIIYTVTSCTENEANRYGRFLCALLGTVMKWHGDKAIFDKECASFPGFVTKFRAANTSMTESSDHVDYENYRHVCHKWHYKITKCVIVCLESKDFIQIRNSLIVLKRILPHYPKVINLANAVERWIERVRAEEKDHRQDLFALATSYIGQLKLKWSTLVAEESFHQKATSDKANAAKNKTLVKEEKPEKPATPKDTKKKPVSRTAATTSETNAPVAAVATTAATNASNSGSKSVNGSATTISAPSSSTRPPTASNSASSTSTSPSSKVRVKDEPMEVDSKEEVIKVERERERSEKETRDREKEKDRTDRDKDRDRSKDRDRTDVRERERDSGRDRSEKDREREKDRDRNDKERERDKDRERVEKDRERERDRSDKDSREKKRRKLDKSPRHSSRDPSYESSSSYSQSKQPKRGR
ncbi:unnamed protein product [Allacma fusca]|uniref:THO complex subunit 2 n=1 Tax=Allacma fusca TaxID=39272 RepID=A0A8J2PVQ3_9HEXA|nr:unnamed protein product [Allacma fusca]